MLSIFDLFVYEKFTPIFHPVCFHGGVQYTDRDDVPKDSNEIFFRNIKFWADGDAPPVFVRHMYIFFDSTGISLFLLPSILDILFS